MSDRDDRTDDVEEPVSDHGTVPTDTRGGSGIGSAAGVSGIGSVGTDFGAAGNVPDPPGVDEEPVTIEDDDDPEVRPPS